MLAGLLWAFGAAVAYGVRSVLREATAPLVVGETVLPAIGDPAPAPSGGSSE